MSQSSISTSMMKLPVLLIFCFTTLVNSLDFKNNGYSNVVISISPDVPESQLIIDNIMQWVRDSSRELFPATHKKAYIESAIILIPQSWKNVDANLTTGYTFTDGSIRVDKANPIYGDYPYTVQTGGCGEKGDHIHVTPEFLLGLNGQTPMLYGPTNKLFIQNWAKYRYGVFDEHGFPGDPIYPLFYYETVYDTNGPKEVLNPNFCTDKPLQGHRQDINNGGSCNFDPKTGLPDENCYFYLDGDNNDVHSSYMALTATQNVDHFCESLDGDYLHDSQPPTKHNLMCRGRTVWDVIDNGDDFQHGQLKPMNVDNPPDTKFQVLRPEEGRFVMVLDCSGSMWQANHGTTRLKRLQKAANDWIKYDVRDDSQVGIVSFGTAAHKRSDMKKINTQTRQDLVKVINALPNDGATNIGGGLYMGMDILNNNQKTKGGVIILISDGENNKGPNLNDPALIARIKKEEVRIVTMAIGPNTDPMLEDFATITNGKTYYIPDGNSLSDLDDAFDGVSTYQPNVPLTDEELLILVKSFSQKSSISSNFQIDETIGRDVTVTLTVDEHSRKYCKNLMVRNVATGAEEQRMAITERTTIMKIPNLQPGPYKVDVELVGSTYKITSADIRVKSKSKDKQTLPIWTKCWVNTGLETIDPNNRKVSILGSVTRGNSPVIGAHVVAYIERQGEDHPLQIDLFDNGSGADDVADDGIYTRFFTDYNGINGRYIIRCQVQGDKDTSFVAQSKSSMSKAILFKNLMASYQLRMAPLTPPCCGSKSMIGETKATGNFQRQSDGGSFKVKNAPSGDIFAPNTVTDLRVIALNSSYILVTFTSPGDDADQGAASKYHLYYEYKENANTTETKDVTEDDIYFGDLTHPFEAGKRAAFLLEKSTFNITKTQYVLYVQAEDEAGNKAGRSNGARWCNECYDPEPPSAANHLSSWSMFLTITFTFILNKML